MSKLKLPTMTHANLARIVARSRDGLAKLAYATTADHFGSTVRVYHHGNNIAALYEDGTVEISTAGWNSTTTTGRLHKIIRDNGINWRVNIKQGQATLTFANDKQGTPFSSAGFRADGHMAHIN